MPITVRAYAPADIPAMTAIWNQVVEEGNAFPQLETLRPDEAEKFFASQSFCGVAEGQDGIAGMYILHPNNVGRCGHLSNASYAVDKHCRGGGVGELLVRHSIQAAAGLGFRVLQFNVVVAANLPAIRLYEKLGFQRLGTIPGGFLRKDGGYEDILLFYLPLV